MEAAYNNHNKLICQRQHNHTYPIMSGLRFRVEYYNDITNIKRYNVTKDHKQGETRLYDIS